MADENTISDSNAPAGEPYDSSISNTPDTPTEGGTEPTETPVNEEFMGFGGYGSGVLNDRSQTSFQLGEGLMETVLNPLDSDAFHNAAINQGPLESIGNGLARGIFGEIIGGTLSGFGALGNYLADGEYNDRNWLERVGNSMMEGANEEFEIYERNPGRAFQFGDAGWWGKNIPSMMSTISMMIPGMAVGKVAAKVGRAAGSVAKLSKAAKAAGTADKIMDVAEAGAKTFGGAVGMRHAENMREAHGAFETARADFLKTEGSHLKFKGTKAWTDFKNKYNRVPENKEELADFVGGSAAYRAYQVNSSNLVFDLMQMHALGKIMKGTRGKWTGRKAAKAAGQSKADVRWATVGDVSKFAIMDMGTEGIEEAVNFVGTEEGLYAAKRMYKGTSEKDLSERLNGYLGDDHLWESAFLGALGGAVFTGASNVAARIKNGKNESAAIDDMADRGKQAAALMAQAGKAEDGEVSPEEGDINRRKAMYDMGVRAAREGAADTAEMQIDTYAQTLRNEGMNEADIAEATEEMRQELAAAEEAVIAANKAAKGAGLTGMEAEMLKKAIIDTSFARKEIAARQEELAPEIESIENQEEQQQEIERQLLEAMVRQRDNLESMGMPVSADLSSTISELEKRAAEHKPIENVVDDAAVSAAVENQSMAEQDLAAADAKVEELQGKDTTSMTEGAKTQLANELADAFTAQKEAQDRVAKAKEEVATAEEGVPPPPVDINTNFAEHVQLGIHDATLVSNRARMTTEDGLNEFREMAKLVEDQLNKKEETDFAKVLSETKNERELKTMLRREKNEERKKQIEDRLKQVKAGNVNPAKEEKEERSKDIPVPTSVQEAVDTLLANSDYVQLNEEGTHYVDSRTGNKYMRTTTWMKGDKAKDEDGFDPSSKWYYPSTNIGNSVDEFTRDFFDGNLRAPEAYPHLPAKLQDGLRRQLQELEAQFIENGERVIAKDVVLFNDMEVSDSEAAGVAGTVDLLTVDKDGNFRIYDMKTMRNARSTKKVEPIRKAGYAVVRSGKAMYGKGDKRFNGGPTKQEAHQLQLSTYRLMLMNQIGAPVPDIGIIPVDVSYEVSESMSQEERQAIVTKRADYLGLIAHTPLAEVNGMKENNLEVEGVNDESVPEGVLPEEEPPTAPTPTAEEERIQGLREKVEALNEEIAQLETSIQNLTDLGGTTSLKFQLLQEKLDEKQQILQAFQEMLGEPVTTPSDTTPIDTTDDAPASKNDLDSLTVKQLRSLAKSLGLSGYSKMRKSDLVDAVHAAQESQRDLLDGTQPDENSDEDQTPDAPNATNIEIEPTAVAFPLSNLVAHFAQQLEVIQEPGREKGPYLVHASTGPVRMTGEQLAAYQALQGAINGTSNEPITFSVEATGKVPTTPINVYTGLKGVNESGLLTPSGKTFRSGKRAGEVNPNDFNYTPGVGDSLVVKMSIGGVEVGTLPTTSELMSAAHLAGQASKTENAFAKKNFSGNTRVGDVVAEENTAMMMQQEAALANATAMHNLRQALFEANKDGLTNLTVEVQAGETGFGQTAQGGLIYSKGLGARGDVYSSVRETIIENGIALQLPTPDGSGKMQIERSDKSVVSPYQQNETGKEGNVNSVPRWNSGSLFVPIMNNGQINYVKVPNRTMSELRSADKLVPALIETLENGDDAQISELQNILGSNAIRKTKEGDWAIYPTNQTSGAALAPMSVRRSSGWTTSIADIVPDMNLDIAVSVTEGSSAFRNPSEIFGVGPMSWNSFNEFIADEVGIGYEPVLDGDGEIAGWTHALAPVYPGKETDTRFVNHDTAATQLVLTVTPLAQQAVEAVEEVTNRVSGGKLVEALQPKTEEKTPEGEVTDELGDFLKDALSGGNQDISWLTSAAAAASSNNKTSTAEDMEVAEAWWKENMPNVPFKRVKGMIRRNGRVGYGIFQAGAVEVSDLAVVGTEFHEAFHAVFQMFLSDSRQEKVLEDARRMFGEKSDKLLEEDLAEHFREYMLTKGLSNKSKSVVRRFFSELYELITSLFANGGKGVRTTLLMQAMNRGAFANKSPRVREYATRNKLIMAEIPQFDSKVQAELESSIKGAGFRAIRQIQRGKGSPEMVAAYNEILRLQATSTRDLQEDATLVGDQTKGELIARKMVELSMAPIAYDFQQILSVTHDKIPEMQLFAKNKQAIMDFFATDQGMIKHMNALVSQEFTAGTDTQEQYNETFEKMNPKDSLSQTVRSLIETTPKITIETFNTIPEVRNLMAAATQALASNKVELARDLAGQIKDIVGKTPTDSFFGLPQTMDVDLVFPFLSERLANKATLEEMYSELDRIGAVYPEFRLLAIKLQQEEAWVQAQFFAGLRRGDTSEIIQTKDYKGNTVMQVNTAFSSVLFTHNKQGISVRLHDLARKNNVSSVEVAQKLSTYTSRQQLKAGEMSNEAFAKTASDLLDKIGFSTKDAQARDRVISLKAGDKEFRTALLSSVRSTLDGFKQMADENSTGEPKVFNANLVNLADMFSPYDMGSVATTFDNVNGSRIYNKQVPSFITEYFDKFERLRTDYLRHRDVARLEKEVKAELFQDPRMYSTTYGRLLFPYGPEQRFNPKALFSGALRSYRVGGVEGGKGAEYTSMTDAQWIEYNLRALDNSINGVIYLPITTPSDATNSYMIPARKYTTGTSGIKGTKAALRAIVQAEVLELQVRPGTFSNKAVDNYMRERVQREDGEKGRYSIKDQTVTEDLIDGATEELFKALQLEAKALALKSPEFVAAAERLGEATDVQAIADTWVMSSYMSNVSTGIALAGTHNEFKNATDMQKRHKHILSPGIASNGLSGRTTFASVTMAETTRNLTKYNKQLADYYNRKGEQVYSEVEIADAQSYVSLEFYKDILMEHGDLTPEKEAAIDKAINGEALDASEVKLLRPYKPFYYTRMFNENTGLLESQQIKNSIVPVLPEGMSPEFSKMAEWMRTNKIDQIQMESAHKVGKNYKDTVKLYNDEDGSFNAVPVPSHDTNPAERAKMVHTLPMTGYRKQVNVTDHWHNDSTNKLASQLEKIVVASAVRNLGKEGEAIAEEFLDTLDSIYEQQRTEFFNSFKDEAGQFQPSIFSDWLVSELEGDGSTPQYVLDLVQEGQFTSPAVIGKVRSRVFSAVNAKVNSVRVAGGTQVQISSQFFRTLGENGENRLKGVRKETITNEDGTKQTVVKPAQIAVSKDSLPKRYKKMDIKSMSIEEIKQKAPELLESITLRIPSEAMNSATVVEIVEFLPDGVDGIVVPDEFVTQMGSDFDVDKLFFQFRANDGSKQDVLYDLQVKVLKDPKVLKEILAPQGFDTFSDFADNPDFQLRSAKQSQFIMDNPMAASSQMWMRSDNMAGVSLKGKAANKNVILLDLVRYGWKFRQDGFKINGQPVEFNGKKASPAVISIHAQAVAAAMDGAKDPVYGKLGITDLNFGMFMELIMMADQTLTPVKDQQEHEAQLLKFALGVIQSKPAQLEANGHIQIKSEDKGIAVVAKTEAGEAFLKELEKLDKDALLDEAGTKITMSTNPNFFTGAQRQNSLHHVTKAIGTWKSQISQNMQYVNSIMRSDKTNVGKDIESQVVIEPGEMGNYGLATIAALEDGKPSDRASVMGGHENLKVKRQMKRMYDDTARMLAELGDSFIEFKKVTASGLPKIGKNLTMQQYDAYKRYQAAAEFANEEVYSAMGERDTRALKQLGENPDEWSLNDWIRHFGAMEANELSSDLQLVLSKLLPSVNPYEMDGKFYDNINLIGVSDDGEVMLVTEALERLYASNDPDMMDFVTAMQAYEAQRSNYQMSQSRLTRILPAQVQREISKAAGANGVTDSIADYGYSFNVGDLLAMSVHDPSIDFLYSETPERALKLAEDQSTGKVYRTVEGKVLLPIGEEKGKVTYMIVKPTNLNSKGRPVKAVGKPIDLDTVRAEQKLRREESAAQQSRQGWYKPELDVDTKVQMLQDRFRRSGLPVKVIIDPSLPVNGQVQVSKTESVVRIHPDKLQGDTIAHEFGHILLEALGYNNPLVKQGIEELRGTELWKATEAAYPDLSTRDLEMEVLTTFIGRRGTDLVTTESGKISKIKTIYNRIMRAIGKLFGIQPKATEQLAQELMFGQGELSLADKLESVQQQRGTQTASDVLKATKRNLRDRMQYLRETGGTSVEAQEALDLAQARYNAAAGGRVIERLSAVADMADDIVASASQATTALDAIASKMRSSATLTETEALRLAQADSVLNDIEALIGSLDNMESLQKDAADMTENELAFTKLAGKIDTLREAKNNLTGAVSDALSNKLKAQTTNASLLEILGDGNMFDLVNNPNLRHLMTDVDSVSKGTLGVKEFKNPVVQAIAKLTANTLESARLQGKEDAGKLSKILADFEAAGGVLSDIVDIETGALKGEYSAEYYTSLREAEKLAASGKDPLAVSKFHAENTEQEFNKEYHTNWTLKNEAIQRLRAKIAVTEGQLKAGMRFSETRKAELNEMRRQFAEMMKEAGPDFLKYHNVEVAEGFEAARDAAAAKVDAAIAESKESGNPAGADVYALRNFDAQHVVIQDGTGKFIPTRGEFSKVEEKAEYKNEAFTGEEMPVAKWRNASFASNPHREVIASIKAVLDNAAGAPGRKFVQQGFLPLGYSSVKDKSAGEIIKGEAKRAKEAFTEAGSAAIGQSDTKGNRIALDARGNAIYVRNSGLFTQPTEAQLTSLKSMSLSDISTRLGQFVKDAHQEKAKQTLEPMAYLTREVFEGSEIIDSKHVLKPGKKGDGLRAAKKLAKGSNVANALDQWFEGVLGDNWEDQSAMADAAGLIQQYTSLMGVGLNIPAWINNFAYGSLQKNLEFRGRDHFSKENNKKARGLISSNFGAIIGDLVKDHNGQFTNKISALIHTLDVADDQRELPFNQKESAGAKMLSHAYIGQTVGEIAMQNQVLFAMMLETEVTLADGTPTNLLDAYQLVDGVLTLPKGTVKTAQGEVVDLDVEFVARLRNKVKSINHYIHGAYNKQDAGTWQRHWMGRLAMQFRRWLPMGVKKRFGERMYNESREREEIGEYRALSNIITAVIGDMQKGQSLTQALEALKEDKVLYMSGKKALREMAIGAGLFLALAALYAFGMDDDDELGVIGALAVNRTERLAQEMITYTPMGLIELFQQTSESPLASWGKVQTMGQLLMYTGQDAMATVGYGEYAMYQTGARKGQSKTWRKFIGMAPGGSHYQRFMDIEQNHKEYSFLYNLIN